MKLNYLDLLDELRAIAQLGLNYSTNPYDLEKYNRLMDLASSHYAEFTGITAEEIKQRFNKELGYITPKLGINGALFNAAGEILLEHRSDDSLWGVPGGWVDVGEGPEDALKREFLEETSMEVEPLEIIKFYTRLPGNFNQPHTSVHILYFCKYIKGDLEKSHESLELCFKDPKTITHWHKDHQRQAEDAMAYYHQMILAS